MSFNSYPEATKHELRQMAAMLIAGCVVSERAELSPKDAAELAVKIAQAVDALEAPAVDEKMAALACPRLHLTIDQRAILNSALFELGQLIKDLAAYSSVRSWHDRAVAVRAKISNVLTAPNISGEKGNTDAA